MHGRKNLLLNQRLAEVQTEQTFDRFLWGDKLISQYFKKKFHYVLLTYLMLKFSIFSKRVLLELRQEVQMYLKKTELKLISELMAKVINHVSFSSNS